MLIRSLCRKLLSLFFVFLHLAWADVGCFGNCSGVGLCLHNDVCLCPAGYSGIDCAVSLPPAGASPGCVALLWHRCVSATQPRIFVHDLPGKYVWTGKNDFGRDTNRAFLSRLLFSEYRTPNPAEATYFFIPAIDGGAGIPRRAAIDWVKEAHPTLWRRHGGRDHVMIGAHDDGALGYFRPREGDSLNLIFISHMGLWLGSRRGADGGTEGSFIPGQDILLPPGQDLGGALRVVPYFQPIGTAAAQESNDARRSILAFFAGTVMAPPSDGRDVGNARAAAAALLANRSDCAVVSGRTADYSGGMANATFCLGLAGQAGGWGRRDTLGALHGCVPALVQDNTSFALEELLDWDAFAVRVSQGDVYRGRLHGLLAAAASSARLRPLQHSLACAWPRFVMSSYFGAVAGEDGSDDAFESVVSILERRRAGSRGAAARPWPRNGDVASPGASPAERHARRAEMQLSSVELCALSSPRRAPAASQQAAAASPASPPPPPPPLRLPCRHHASPLGNACSGDPFMGGAVCERPPGAAPGGAAAAPPCRVRPGAAGA